MLLSLAAGYVVCQASIASDPGRNRPQGWELAQEPQWEVCQKPERWVELNLFHQKIYTCTYIYVFLAKDHKTIPEPCKKLEFGSNNCPLKNDKPKILLRRHLISKLPIWHQMYVVANVAYFKCCNEVLHALKFHIVFYISNFLRNRIIQASINDSLFATFYNT